jgi:outer membrane lipase/esterase
MSLLHSRPLRSGLALALAALVAAPAMAQGPFSRTVFFGDSLTDSGHFRPVLMQVNPNANLVGRFTTNPGFVWAEYLAQHYGTSAAANGNGQGGDNYAVGGARAGLDTVGALGATPSLATQAARYLAANGGRADGNALYTVWGGANDLFAVAAGAPAATTIGQSVASQVGIVSSLKAAGARYVMVPNLPDIGITPQFIAGGPAAQAQATGLATAYNNALYSTLAAQGLEVIPLDTFGMLRELAANPAQYGFANVTNMACTSGQSISCVPTELARPDAATSYLFADGVHPTGRTHEILAQYAASVIDGPRQQQLVARSAQASGRARIDQVAGHLAPGQADGTAWWGGVRGDMQRYESGKLYDGIAPEGLFGVDWVKDGRAVGVFAGFGQMNADFGNSGGDFDLGQTTVGAFGSFEHDAFWINGQVSYSWLDADIDRQINLGPAKRSHRGQADGSNLAVGVNAGWEFNHGALHHGPVLGVSYQDTTLEGYAEQGGGATALTYADTDVQSFVGRLGWQLRIAADGFQPYARVTWDNEFEDAPSQARAHLQSQPQLGDFRVPGMAFDSEYGTAVVGARFKLLGLDANVGMSGTFGASESGQTGVFANLSGSF